MPFVPNLKELSQKPELLSPGHRLCPGCGIGVILRQTFAALDDPVIVVCATGCLEICTSCYPETAWNVPWIHVLFENTAAVASGIEAMKKVLEKKGRLTPRQKRTKILAIAGDGGAYDIGLQALSGAFERGHDFVFLCCDNEGYQNTGNQRSSSSPFGAATSTTPVGKKILGKQQFRKDLTQIAAAHNIPYAAQASPSNFADLMQKMHKAFTIKGPAFVNVLSMCPANWKIKPEKGLCLLKNAVDTCFWPLYEVENGITRITYRPARKLPIGKWLEGQGRFKHFFKPGNEHLIKTFQKEVDRRWNNLQKQEKA